MQSSRKGDATGLSVLFNLQRGVGNGVADNVFQSCALDARICEALDQLAKIRLRFDGQLVEVSQYFCAGFCRSLNEDAGFLPE
jgi:hypothetical protein